MKLIEDINQLHKKYSVWVFGAIFVVSALEAAEPLYQPFIPIWVFPLVVGVLTLLGIVVRGIAQDGN